MSLPISKIKLGNDIRIDHLISLPSFELNLGKYQIRRSLDIKKGIDLAGGAHLVFQANMDSVPEADRDSALIAAKSNIERRVNLFGLTEAVVQTSKLDRDYRLVVELPGVENLNQAISLLGQTAMLGFYEIRGESTSSADFEPTELTGKDLARSEVKFDSNTGEPQVGIIFNSDGAKKFSDITKRNIGKPLAIYLDQVPITAPTVREEISGGEAVITGNFTLDQAKQLSIQLNAGALPVPLKIVEQRNIGATLGEESVRKSVLAGLVGLLMVIIFMIIYYGKLGFLADIGLIIYGLLTLALYKIIPVTLTLPGIAGFILSIGMAVDSNILIFERMKEEIRSGKSRKMAMELGFGRAWDSIRDANICTIITCFVLFNPFGWPFLNDSGLVRGFALTLFLGVALSLFTGIVVTRTILRVFLGGSGK